MENGGKGGDWMLVGPDGYGCNDVRAGADG